MKFVANKKITDHTFSFQSANSAKDAPLVKELFNFPFIKEVLSMKIIFPFPKTIQYNGRKL